MAESNNNVYTGNRTLLNASHLKRADKDNGYGDILWARDIDWNDISISSNLWGYDKLTSLIIIQKLEDLLNRVTALENQTPTPIIPVDPTLTISNPVSTTIADGGSTTITVTSNVEGKLTLTTASGTGWNATSSSASTAATIHTITVTNLTATTTAGSIAAGGIVATFTPTDTTKYNTLTSQNVLKESITLSAAAPQTTYYWYAGQTNPSTMTSISPVVTSYENGGGWYELGTTLPTSINQLIKGGTAGNIWYVAVPANSNLVPGSSADPDTSVDTGPNKVFNGVTYQIYIYEGVTGTRYSFELNI